MCLKNIFIRLFLIIFILETIQSTVLMQTIQNYLNLEKLLWSDITFHIKELTLRTDDVAVLDQIRFEHLNLFRNNFTGYEMEYNLFLIRDKFVFENMMEISKSVNEALNTYLIDSDVLFDELQTVLITQYQLNLSKRMDNLFEFMSTNGFEYFMKGVS